MQIKGHIESIMRFFLRCVCGDGSSGVVLAWVLPGLKVWIARVSLYDDVLSMNCSSFVKEALSSWIMHYGMGKLLIHNIMTRQL